MLSEKYNFYLLCIGEGFVVVTGFTSIPAATALQILILLGIFRDLVSSKNAYRPIVFLASLTIATVLFTGIALSFRHMFLPLLVLAVTAAFAVLYLIFTEYRLEQRFGGSA